MKSPFNFLRKEYSAFIALIMVMAVQIEHNAEIFERRNHTTPYMGWLYAAAIEYAIVHFVANKPRWIPPIYAASSLVANIIYYCYNTDGHFVFDFIGIFISLTLSFSVFAFSESLVHTIDKRTSKEPRSAGSVESKKFACDECDAVFEKSSELTGHKSTHKRMRNRALKNQGGELSENTETNSSLPEKPSSFGTAINNLLNS